MEDHSEILVALVGQPNSGKSTVFNYLTGLHQTIANYPGVTVTKKFGHYHDDKRRIEVVDLPGTYSLTSYSQEERVTRDFLLLERPEVVVDVIDAANLRRHLYFVFQLLELQIPLVVCLNMMDTAKRRGVEIDVDKLQSELGVPVIPTVARYGYLGSNRRKRDTYDHGLENLRQKINEISKQHAHEVPPFWKIDYGQLETLIAEFDSALSQKTPLVQDFPTRWLAIKLLENDREARRIVQHHTHDKDWEVLLEACTKKAELYEQSSGDSPRKTIAACRNEQAEKLEKQIVKRNSKTKRHSDKIDLILCQPVLGLVCVALVMFGIFKLAFNFSDGWEWLPWISEDCKFLFTTPVGAVDGIFSFWIPSILDYCFRIPEGDLHSLIHDGVIAGIGGILVFMPTIFFIFLFVSFLEQSGYIARVVVVMDRIMRVFGIHGQSILPLILGGGIIGGCAIPAVMATRTMREQRERLLTIMIVPLMNCGAKIPLYALLISAFFLDHKELVMAAIIFISWSIALISSSILGKTFVKEKPSPLIIELPAYQMPNLHNMFLAAGLQSWWFVKKAGTIILAVNVLLWVLMYYPRPATPDITNSEQLANSYAAKLGRLFEPVSKYAGFDWRDNVALIGGFAAKEVIVSSLATMYGIENDNEPQTNEKKTSESPTSESQTNESQIEENNQNERTKDKDKDKDKNKNKNNDRDKNNEVGTEAEAVIETDSLDNQGKRLAIRLRGDSNWSGLKGFVMILFVMIYAPCVATCAVIWRETGHIKYMLAATIYTTTTAIIIAIAVYQIGSLISKFM
ncbi:MAG: ferrous iron transport protein B [Planctomycetaceae bacterium]|jgi:ferrous iron transport protein B|nr:ferrous iron transport protein B [Planctomycetaceae bacterium]